MIVLLLLAGMWAVAAGCAAAGKGAASSGEVARPAGFTLAATVHPGEAREIQPWRRGARFVLESDLNLRAGTGRLLEGPGGAYPPLVRRISPWEMDHLWLLVDEARLTDEGHPGRVSPPPPEVVEAEHIAVVFEVTRDHRPVLVVVALDGQSEESRAAERVLAFLAQLSWME